MKAQNQLVLCLHHHYDNYMTRIKILAWNQQGYDGLTDKSTFINSKCSMENMI